MKKGSKVYAITKLKCPHCQSGDLFYSKGFYPINKPVTMYPECPTCGQDFMIEPGYYTAAMWISYPILMVVLLPAMFIVAFNGGTVQATFLTMLITILMALSMQIPLIRYSRAILINIEVPYRGF